MTDYSVDKMTIDMVNGTIGSASVKQDGRLVGYSVASHQMTGADGAPLWGVFHPGTEIHFTAEDGGGNRVKKTFTFTPLNDCDAETALLRIKGRVAEVKAWADAIKATVPPETCSTTINGHAVTVTRTEPGVRAVLTIDGTSYSECNWTESRLLTDTTNEVGYGILARDGSDGRNFWRGDVVVNVDFPRVLRIEADAVRTIACVLKKRAEKVIAAFKELEQNPVVQVLGKSVTLHVANGYVRGFTIDGKQYDDMRTDGASEALTGLKLCCGAEWIGLPFFVHTVRDGKMVTVEWEDGGNERRGTSTSDMRPEWFASCIEARVAKVKRAMASATPDPCDCESDVWVGEIRGMSVSVTRARGAEPIFTIDGTGFSYGNPRGNSSFHFSREVTGTDNEEGLGILQDGTYGGGETKYYRGGRSVCVPDIAAIPSRVTMPLGEMMRIVIARADAVCEAFDPCDCAAKTLVIRRDAPGSEVSFIYDGAAYGRTRNNCLWKLSRDLTGTCDETGQGIFENDTGLESESFTAMYSDGSTSAERVFTFGDNLNFHTDSIEEIGRKIGVRVGVVKAWADRVRCTLPDQKTGVYTITL